MTVSSTITYKYSLLFFSIICVSLWAGCSKNGHQRDFEDKAFQKPERVTQTDANGKVEDEDPGDWNVSPRYAGLIRVSTPAYPNPVAYNTHLRIELYLRGVENVNTLEVFAFKYPDQQSVYGPLYVDDNLSSSFSFVTINLKAKLVANAGGASQTEGVYRLLIYDAHQKNLITYGDVQVGVKAH